MFGLVLGELTETSKPTSPPTKMEDVSVYAHARPVAEIPMIPENENVLGDLRLSSLPASSGAIRVDETALAAARHDATSPRSDPAPRREPAPAAAAADRTPARPAPTASERTEIASVAPGAMRIVPETTIHAAAYPGASPSRPEPAADARPVGTAAGATYTVKAGDSLIRIARTVYGPQHEREYKRILQANRDKVPDETVMQVGTVLVIPPLAGAPAAPDRSASSGGTVAPSPRPSSLPVAMTQEELRRYFQGHAPTTVKAGSGRVYVVRRGDSLSKIARTMLKDDSPAAVQKIYNANKDKLKSPDHLPVGVELRIPSEG